MCLWLELELCRLLREILLRHNVSLDLELRLGFGHCLPGRTFSRFSIRPPSSAGSFGPRWGIQVYRPIRTKAWIRYGSWLTFE